MAHEITEPKFGSREGSSRGAAGVNDTRTFFVKLDITDAEFTEARYPDPRGIVEIYKVPYGQGSPWNAFAKATQYEIVERLTNKTWKVRVTYRTGGAPAPTMEASWGRWMVSIRGAATTEQIIEEPTEAIEAWEIDRPGHLIGTSHFAKGIGADNAARFSAELSRPKADGTIEEYDQPLHRTKSVNVRPYTADVPALTYTQTRLFANFNLERVGLIAEYYKRVNLFEYLGAKPAHLKFMDFTLDEVSHAIGTPETSPQLEYGIAYRASVVFLWSAKAFTPLRLVSTVTDEIGNQSPVFREDGTKDVDVNWTIAGMDFTKLLTIVQGGIVKPPIGGRPRR